MVRLLTMHHEGSLFLKALTTQPGAADSDFQSSHADDLRLVHLLASGVSHKGEDVRLTGGSSAAPASWPRQAIPSRWWRWKEVASWRFKHQFGPEHINALELRSFLTALKWRVRSRAGLKKRNFHLLDSQVSIGVITKGRTSSRKLRLILEKIAALTVASKTVNLCGFCRTDDNPADRPSRRAKVSRRWGGISKR